MDPSSELHVVDVEDVRRPDDYFHCDRLRGDLSAATCVKKQERAAAATTPSERFDTRHCRKCPAGDLIAARIPFSKPEPSGSVVPIRRKATHVPQGTASPPGVESGRPAATTETGSREPVAPDTNANAEHGSPQPSARPAVGASEETMADNTKATKPTCKEPGCKEIAHRGRDPETDGLCRVHQRRVWQRKSRAKAAAANPTPKRGPGRPPKAASVAVRFAKATAPTDVAQLVARALAVVERLGGIEKAERIASAVAS